MLTLLHIIVFIFLFYLAGSVGDEEPSHHSERPISSQCLRLQPHQTGPGIRDAGASLRSSHSAAARGHEDLSQPPAGINGFSQRFAYRATFKCESVPLIPSGQLFYASQFMIKL